MAGLVMKQALSAPSDVGELVMCCLSRAQMLSGSIEKKKVRAIARMGGGLLDVQAINSLTRKISRTVIEQSGLIDAQNGYPEIEKRAGEIVFPLVGCGDNSPVKGLVLCAIDPHSKMKIRSVVTYESQVWLSCGNKSDAHGCTMVFQRLEEGMVAGLLGYTVVASVGSDEQKGLPGGCNGDADRRYMLTRGESKADNRCVLRQAIANRDWGAGFSVIGQRNWIRQSPEGINKALEKALSRRMGIEVAIAAAVLEDQKTSTDSLEKLVIGWVGSDETSIIQRVLAVLPGAEVPEDEDRRSVVGDAVDRVRDRAPSIAGVGIADSAMLRGRVESLGKRAPKMELVVIAINAVKGAGGEMSLRDLMDALDMKIMRARGFVASLSLVLNMNSARVVTVNDSSNSISMNFDLMDRIFFDG